MKRRVLMSGGNLVALALSLGLMGCGSSGVEEGVPSGDLTPAVKMDPKMVDMTGRSFKDAGVSQSKAAAAAKADSAGAPAPEKK